MHLSIFDLDSTLLRLNSSFHYYIFLYKHKIFPKSSILKLSKHYFKYQFLDLSPEDLHSIVFNNFLKGRYLNIISEYVDMYLEKYLDSIFYMPALKACQKAICQGHVIYILSNSPEFLVRPIAKILKVKYKASSYRLDKENRLIEIDSIMDGNAKAKYAKQLIKELSLKKEDVTVYSDSIWDLPLFEIAGIKIAVNPEDKLLDKAKMEKWKIL